MRGRSSWKTPPRCEVSTASPDTENQQNAGSQSRLPVFSFCRRSAFALEPVTGRLTLRFAHTGRYAAYVRASWILY